MMEERERRGEDGTICHVSAFGFVDPIRCFLHLWFVAWGVLALDVIHTAHENRRV